MIDCILVVFSMSLKYQLIKFLYGPFQDHRSFNSFKNFVKSIYLYFPHIPKFWVDAHQHLGRKGKKRNESKCSFAL